LYPVGCRTGKGETVIVQILPGDSNFF